MNKGANDTFPDPSDDEVREIASMPDAPPEAFNEFAFFIEGISNHQQALARSGESSNAAAEPEDGFSQKIQAIFDMAGRLIQKLSNDVQDLFPQPRAIPGAIPRGANPATEGFGKGESSPASFISGIRVPVKDLILTLEWHQSEDGPVIRVNALTKDGSFLRPFRFVLADEGREPLADPVIVDAIDSYGEVAPGGRGIYVFEFSWNPDGKHVIVIEIK